MGDAEQVSEIKPAIVLRIPPGEQEVGGAARLPGIGRRQIEKPVEGLDDRRSEEHTSELQSLMRISYAVFCLKKKNQQQPQTTNSKPHTTNYTLTNTLT